MRTHSGGADSGDVGREGTPQHGNPPNGEPKKELTEDYLLRSSQFTEAHAESTTHSVQLKVSMHETTARIQTTQYWTAFVGGRTKKSRDNAHSQDKG